ncbi:DUF2066 domain-containing protein [Psychromonas sp. CD1]|uniref:DUF2066 domain-containing protein n=1 Tax=Psychromonas sp. CD1 TaxID=1979839 RepID=UPI000B9B3BAB|nr:DUF2066 domain-containing protein [Psychromonas sp. CD1]
MTSFSVKQLFFILMIVTFCGSTIALQSMDPYQGKIVAQSGKKESALKMLAFKQVFVKVSGNKEVNHLPGSQLSLNEINSFIEQFSYQKGAVHTYFIASFDAQKINKALHDLQQPIWGETRPTTLIWLVKSDQLGRDIVSDSYLQRRADKVLSESIVQQQFARGIPLQFPLMDLDDSLAVSVTDISGRFYRVLTSASKRYHVANFVSAELLQINAQQWELSWQLLTNTTQNQVLLSGMQRGEKSQVIEQMLDAISDYYAHQYAILEQTGGKFSQIIHINGIDSLTRMTQLHQLLSKMESVASYQILNVDQNVVNINVNIKGGLQSFANAFEIQPHLRAVSSESEPFSFNWQ